MLCNATIDGNIRWKCSMFYTRARARLKLLTCEDEGDARGEHEYLPLPGAETASAEHQGHRHHGARHEEEPRGFDHGV